MDVYANLQSFVQTSSDVRHETTRVLEGPIYYSTCNIKLTVLSQLRRRSDVTITRKFMAVTVSAMASNCRVEIAH